MAGERRRGEDEPGSARQRLAEDHGPRPLHQQRRGVEIAEAHDEAREGKAR